MTVLEEIVQIVRSLGPEEQRRVLAVAAELRDAQGLPDISLPPADAGEAARATWRGRVRARSAVVLEEERRRLLALGIIDEQWNVVTDELPADMLPTSETSVET